MNRCFQYYFRLRLYWVTCTCNSSFLHSFCIQFHVLSGNISVPSTVFSILHAPLSLFRMLLLWWSNGGKNTRNAGQVVKTSPDIKLGIEIRSTFRHDPLLRVPGETSTHYVRQSLLRKKRVTIVPDHLAYYFWVEFAHLRGLLFIRASGNNQIC